MILIYIIFLVAFVAASLVDYGLIPPQVTLATEGCIYFLFIYSIILRSKKNRAYCLHFLPLIVFFMNGTLVSIILNGMFNFQPVFSLRLILRFYIFYIALINLEITTADLKRINVFLFTLFIIQLPATATKYYLYGLSEKTVGTYGTSGALTPIIPIIAIGYLAGYYFFYKAKRVFILLAFGFFLVGVVGIKAALLFLYPATFFALFYLLVIRVRKISVAKKILIFFFVVLLSAGSGAAIISVSKRLNPERVRGGGSIDLSFALERSKEYTTSISPDGGYGSGRIGTTRIAFDTVWEGGLGRLFFGYGPGSLTTSFIYGNRNADSRLSRMKRSYGVTGMAYVLVEYGIYGLVMIGLMFCVFAHLAWKWYNSEIDPYWKAFSLGSLVFATLNAFVFFAYNVAFIGDFLPPIYFYVMAAMYIRRDESLQTTRSKQSL